MKNLKKSLRYSLYLVLVCVMCAGCLTKKSNKIKKTNDEQLVLALISTIQKKGKTVEFVNESKFSAEGSVYNPHYEFKLSAGDAIVVGDTVKIYQNNTLKEVLEDLENYLQAIRANEVLGNSFTGDLSSWDIWGAPNAEVMFIKEYLE